MPPGRGAGEAAGTGGASGRQVTGVHLVIGQHRPSTCEASARSSVLSLAGAHLVGADVVEVAPAHDHAEMTTVAAAHVAFELLALMLLGR